MIATSKYDQVYMLSCGSEMTLRDQLLFAVGSNFVERFLHICYISRPVVALHSTDNADCNKVGQGANPDSAFNAILPHMFRYYKFVNSYFL